MIVVIYRLNFSFKMQCCRKMRVFWRKLGNFSLRGLSCVVYPSAPIPRKIPSPIKFLVTHLFLVLSNMFKSLVTSFVYLTYHLTNVRTNALCKASTVTSKQLSTSAVLTLLCYLVPLKQNGTKPDENTDSD